MNIPTVDEITPAFPINGFSIGGVGFMDLGFRVRGFGCMI